MYILVTIIGILLISLDQVTKYLAYTKLRFIDEIKIIDGVFRLKYVENRGAAFGIFQGARWIFVVITIVVLAVIIYQYIKLPKNKVYSWVRTSLVLVFAGAVGNFIGRFFDGYVVDFFDFYLINFPVFNIADIYIVTGAVLMGILFVFFVKDEGGSAKEHLPEDNMDEDESSVKE